MKGICHFIVVGWSKSFKTDSKIETKFNFKTEIPHAS